MKLSDKKGLGRRDHGFSLVEILVATAVFAIAVGVAFTLYNAAQSSYKDAEEFTSQQQNTRVAFDKIVSDLRMAGFNYNPGPLSRCRRSLFLPIEFVLVVFGLGHRDHCLYLAFLLGTLQ